MQKSLFARVVSALLITGAVGTVVIAGSAGAIGQTIPTSRSVTVRPTDWSGSLTFPKFDPTLGRLESVAITAHAEVAGGGRMENLGPSVANVTLELAATVDLDTLDPTAGPAGHLRLSPLQSRAVSLAGFDGVIDFTGPSGVAFSDLQGVADASHTSLDPAVLSLFSGPGTITLAASAVAASRATGSGNLISAFATDAGVTASVVYTYKIGHVSIDKVATSPTVVVSPASSTAPIVYDVTVRNDGELPLDNVAVTDANPNAAACTQNYTGTLAVNASWTYQCTSTVPVVANPAPGGQTETNTAVVVANAGTNPVTGESTSVVTLVTPKISLTKVADLPIVAVGAAVPFTLVVTNTGSVALTNILVSDPLVPTCQATIPVLGPAETAPAIHCSLAAAVSDFVNSATVTAQAGVITVSATASAPVRVVTPALQIAKTVNGLAADAAPGPSVVEGDVLTFGFVVTNPSTDDTVTNITVTDNRLGPVSCPFTTLGPGASMTCTPLAGAASGIGPQVNTATAKGRGTGGVEVQATNPAHYLVEAPPPPPVGPCTATGSLEGLRFVVNGGEQSAADLSWLSIHSGDRVAMEWTSVTPGHDGCTFSLATYKTASTQFNPTEEQPLTGSVSCTPGSLAQDCRQNDGTYRIEIVVTTPDPLCAFQLDAITGLPFATVGPQGGFYSQMFNGTRQLLFSAAHGR